MKPESWTEAALGDVATLHQGVGFPKVLQGRAEGELGFYKVSDISRAVLEGRELLGSAAHCISRQEARHLRAAVLPAKSIVFARIGEAIGLNRRAVLPAEALVDNNVIGVKARPGVADRYLLHFLRTVKLRELSQATTVPAVRSSDIAAIRVPVPPSNEQERIVDRLDELFSEIDEGERALERVQKLVERYRQSVLKAAVSGDLTSDWRAHHASGESQDVESGGPIALPPGWVWTTVVRAGEVRLGRQRAPQHHQGDHMRPYLRVANVYEDKLDLTDVKEMNFTPKEFETYALRPGDILLNEGQSPELVGRPAIYRGEIPGCCYQKTLLRFRARPGVLPDFALLVFRYYLHSGRFRRSANITTSIAHLAAERFEPIEFPLPPESEQAAIVDSASALLGRLAHLEVELVNQRAASRALREATLKAAFSGQLVPQDPTEEPATVLLARLAAQAADAPAAPKTRGRSPRQPAATT